ncbi:CDP-glycerol glycerophosphotransferase family protein [Streptomyces sp. NPDC005435]|uniref:bifunctional glycosyltransferase/CDP-glycerol:glycerophosphate glycerophosphotransferase n=1 Tax=Streptomyces sp. NPDC005435 TaxID=3154464 RepID=UPI003455FD3E
MPRFSVIVPAYEVQAYLSECLDSVLSQSYADLELIAVDDGSPDACGTIIDEYAGRDARVRPLHLTANQGLGPARNAGMAGATGDYLLFLDGDDTLTPHTLRAVADRIRETGDPDVLVFDYARTYGDGREVRNREAGRLAEHGPVPFRLRDRPGLLRLLMVAWNKAYRREFVEHGELAFPPGYYEDTPWTFPVLMTADTIATLDRVCVHYRQRHTGSILRTTSDRHFDVLDQYERVFAYVDARPELDCWRPELFNKMVEHYAAVFSRPDRLPRRSRPRFLRRARAHHRRYRVADAPRPSRRARVRHALIRFGLHRTYRALLLAGAVRRRTRAFAAGRVRALRAAALRLHYRVQLRLPLREDDAVFADCGHTAGHGNPGGDPAALAEALRVHAPHIRTAWITHPGGPCPGGARPLRAGSAACWSALARSKYLISNGVFAPGVRKRPGQVFLQTGDPAPRPGTAPETRPQPLWDYTLAPGPHTAPAAERTTPGRCTALAYGRPRNDVLQRATPADVTRLRTALGIPEGTVAILYAPARRDHPYTRRPVLDLERLARELGPRFVVLVRAGRAPVLWRREIRGVLDVSAHPSAAELCLASDVLLTDGAPLMFDYAGLDRPIVVHAGDGSTEAPHASDDSAAPGEVARGEDEVIGLFVSGRWRDSGAEGARAAFRERFCPLDDGRAAERIVRHVMLGRADGLPEVIPVVDRRPVPSAAVLALAPPAPVPQAPGPRTVTEGR